MTLRTLLFISLSLFLFACGDDASVPGRGGPADATPDSSEPDASEPDASEPDASEPDASGDAAMPDASADASAPDASAHDASAPDASSCPRSIPDREAGVCDGIGMMICSNWATLEGGPTAVAQCVPLAGRCARADRCGDGMCTCGGGPECGDDQMCVSGIAGFTCVCL